MNQRLKHTWEVEKELQSSSQELRRVLDITKEQDLRKQDLSENRVWESPLCPEGFAKEKKDDPELAQAFAMAHLAILDQHYELASNLMWFSLNRIQEVHHGGNH